MWEAALFSSLELANGVSALQKGSELLTTPLSLSTSASALTKLQTSPIVLCRSNFRSNFGTIYKKQERERFGFEFSVSATKYL